jgi:hypothetical protein
MSKNFEYQELLKFCVTLFLINADSRFEAEAVRNSNSKKLYEQKSTISAAYFGY